MERHDVGRTRVSETRRDIPAVRCTPFFALLALAAAGCQRSQDKPKQTQPPSAIGAQAAGSYPTGISIPGAVAEDGRWLMPLKDLAGTRFSGLDQIDTTNVKSLKLAWTFSTGVTRGHEAPPIVADSTMYIVTPFPNVLYALDLTKEGAPLKWRYDPKPDPASQGVACCDLVNRGAVYADGRLFYNTLDAHTVAVDARTGRELWKTKVGEYNNGESMTMAPLVVGSRVFVGNSGGEFGVRGWLTALDAATGKIAWRAYSTGPDSEVLIGPDFKPHYAQDQGKDLGVKTWPPDAWKIGGGTVWGWVTYDADQDLIIYGTGNPGPWNAEQRPGDNKWTAGVFARSPATGAARWFYQWGPHDLWDYDGINEDILVNMPLDGQQRKLLLRAERDGYIYVMDRTTGQVISATPYVHITSTLGVDLQSGRLRENPEKHPTTGKVVRDVCPAAPGAKDWQPAAFSPKSGLLYIAHNNICMDFEAVEANYIAGTPYVGANVVMHAGPGGHRGEFTAWDPVAKAPRWKLTERFPVWSGVLATAGEVVFYGTMDGWLKALNARTGTELWKFKVGSGVISPPMTYRGPDGKQYIAVAAGVGGWAGAIVAGNLDARDSTSALGFVGAMADLPQFSTKGGMVYAFALP